MDSGLVVMSRREIERAHVMRAIDKAGVFRVNAKGPKGGDGFTQFGRAMSDLNIDVICANTPAAKGRVERAHQTLQDRLVKELRPRRIWMMDDANAPAPPQWSPCRDRRSRQERPLAYGAGPPPAQIRASTASALGSCLGYDRQSA